MQVSVHPAFAGSSSNALELKYKDPNLHSLSNVKRDLPSEAGKVVQPPNMPIVRWLNFKIICAVRKNKIDTVCQHVGFDVSRL
ncbi:MAG: hypothetical protein U0V49_00475 [Saprospiraceae bacterium]